MQSHPGAEIIRLNSRFRAATKERLQTLMAETLDYSAALDYSAV
jgi:hypothetical protein